MIAADKIAVARIEGTWTQADTTRVSISGWTTDTLRAYTLPGLTNYVWYTVTLDAMLDGAPFLTDTVQVMPTDRFVYLPVVQKAR